MNRWNTTISTAAATREPRPGENSSTSGAMISTVVPATWAINVGDPRRPQVAGEVAVVRTLERI